MLQEAYGPEGIRSVVLQKDDRGGRQCLEESKQSHQSSQYQESYQTANAGRRLTL